MSLALQNICDDRVIRHSGWLCCGNEFWNRQLCLCSIAGDSINS